MSINIRDWDRRLCQVGGVVARYGLVLIFVAFGLLKFTPEEAAAIQPLGAHSPLFVWLYSWASPQLASNVIGVIELAFAALIATRRILPLASAVGSLGAALALVTTLSFLVTTPQLDPNFQGFILKDVVLLGAALWCAGEALSAARRQSRPARQVATAATSSAPAAAAVLPRHDLSPTEIDEIEDQLYAFNAARIGCADAAPLGFVAEHLGVRVGAVAGYTWGGVCELRQVWVREGHRHTGLGARLMRQALDEARRRGCAHVFLATYDFQAPAFYAKLGFDVAAEVRDKPLGHSELVMRLSLGQSDTTGA